MLDPNAALLQNGLWDIADRAPVLYTPQAEQATTPQQFQVALANMPAPLRGRLLRSIATVNAMAQMAHAARATQ